MRINLKNIEENVRPLGGKANYDKEFIFDLLAAYGRASGNITRLRNGQLNVANNKDIEVAQKNVVYFKPTTDNVYSVIDDLKTDPTVVRYSTRFVIVTDYKKLLAFDTKTSEPLDIDISEISKYYAFFLPWAGMEKAQFVGENHADVKAAEKMAKLFDAIIAGNDTGDASYYHNLNVFFTRILFCFFAEDTGIFKKDQFTNSIGSFTQKDGSDVSVFLQELFTALDIEDKTGYVSHIAAFPYVNGKLFHTTFPVPEFNRKARDLLLECGNQLDWSDINPDIFGSMIQAVVNPGQRASLGMHYTSVPNIMKTIEPLFLDELKDEINKYWDEANKLDKILSRIGNIKIFDPACGSGNFLIIAYKELRKLEHTILERQSDLTSTNTTLLGSRINIENFYGIEIDDFAHEVAILSLWLAKHQMNLEFYEKFGIDIPLIPLKEAGNIVHGNAARIDWRAVCPNSGTEQIYLIGNPPYQGFLQQSPESKRDMDIVFGKGSNSRKLDYISIWFLKGKNYIQDTLAELAFVSTNSVTQGEQVALLWPRLLVNSIEIGFAYLSFKWSNTARGNAGVTCVIVSLRPVSKDTKYIFDQTSKIMATNINGYLADSKNLFIGTRSKPLSNLPPMTLGSSPYENGLLLLSPEERKKLVTEYSQSEKLIRKFVGSSEFVRSQDKFCLWIEDKDLELANSIPPIKLRIDKVRNFRLQSNRGKTKETASTPHKFTEIRHKDLPSIIIPIVSSERRQYIPIGYLDSNDIIPNSARALYSAEIYVFGLLNSNMHMAWVRAVAGRLKTDIRYSASIVYNNFPVPIISMPQKQLIEEKAFGILDARENHPEKTLADLYDPDKMPDDLRQAHYQLDNVIDSIYRKKPFDSDEERLAHLFDLYEQMTAHEKER